MTRTVYYLFCDNEHGVGDVSFPEALRDVDVPEFEKWDSIAKVRREAKKAGWRRYKGVDYCPSCVESEENRES